MAAQFYKLINITKFAYNGQILWYAHFIQNFLYKKSEKCVCVYLKFSNCPPHSQQIQKKT